MTGDHQALANTLALLGWEPRKFGTSNFPIVINRNYAPAKYVDCMWYNGDDRVAREPQLTGNIMATTAPMPWDEFGAKQLRLFLIKAQQP